MLLYHQRTLHLGFDQLFGCLVGDKDDYAFLVILIVVHGENNDRRPGPCLRHLS